MTTPKIDTVTAREKLKARHAPYWMKLRTDCHLGYQKITPSSTGSWIARFRDQETRKYQLHSLGGLDSVTGARRYDEAVKISNQWFDHRNSGGTSKSINVEQAWERFFTKLKNDGKLKALTQRHR